MGNISMLTIVGVIFLYYFAYDFRSAMGCDPDSCNRGTQCSDFIHLHCSVEDEQAQSWIQANNGSLTIRTFRHGWLPVCSESFWIFHADTYCQLLGFSRTVRYFRTNRTNGEGLKCDDHVCNRRSNCVHNVLLICTHEQFALQYRLYNNHDTISNSGRLEFFQVYWNNTKGIGGYDWLPHCIETFNISIADFYCRKLGYSHADSYDTVTALGFPKSSSPVSAQVIYYERQFIDIIDKPECNHSMNVGLICSNYSDDNIRLITNDGNTNNVSTGFLQILVNTEWTTACYSIIGHNIINNISCKQLGYSGSHDVQPDIQHNYTDIFNSTVWLEPISCDFNTSDLHACSEIKSTGGECPHKNMISCAQDSTKLIQVATESNDEAANSSSTTLIIAIVSSNIFMISIFLAILITTIMLYKKRRRKSESNTNPLNNNTTDDPDYEEPDEIMPQTFAMYSSPAYNAVDGGTEPYAISKCRAYEARFTPAL